MASNPSSTVGRMLKQVAVVIAASYFGAVLASGFYQALWMSGFHFQGFGGHLTGVFIAGGLAAPIASVFASVLVSRYADHIQASKLGILLSVLASYCGVVVEVTLLDAELRVLHGTWVGNMLLLLWPAVVGVFSFLGYQAGLVIVRRWHSRAGAEHTV